MLSQRTFSALSCISPFLTQKIYLGCLVAFLDLRAASGVRETNLRRKENQTENEEGGMKKDVNSPRVMYHNNLSFEEGDEKISFKYHFYRRG